MDRIRSFKPYNSPIGTLYLVSDDIGLCDLVFEENFKQYSLKNKVFESTSPFIESAEHFLDLYFSGTNPDFTPPLHLCSSTFQDDVLKIVLQIGYSSSVTYGTIANMLTSQYGMKRMSAQAVGQAVGRNRIPIIIPCHRVLGTNGKITGYSGGLERKRYLLN
ncbi:MAG: methylated-DNA--[protein]-cysteine S-methyltransferase, partial [Succinivibrio sp.]